MTAALVRGVGRRPIDVRRLGWAVVTTVVVAWSAVRAGLDLGNLVNERGWGQVEAFARAAVRPETDADFLRLTLEEAGVTLAFALLGTLVSLLIGVPGGVLLAERTWRGLDGRSRTHPGWLAARGAFAVPRSMHEVVFGLFLVNILGLDPLVAVLAIGVPFGAVTAKVFSEFLDDVDDEAERALRSAGAGRLAALAFGVVPVALADLVSYAFYRFECAIRAAAVLGIVGAGGLGFQLALSFQSLRYEQMWTLLWALVVVSGVADWMSAVVRRRRALDLARLGRRSPGSRPPRDRMVTGLGVGLVALVPVAAWWAEVDVTTLWSARTRRLAGEFGAELWPPEIGDGGVSGLAADSADTVALAVLALAIAFPLASLVAFAARRPAATGVGIRALVARVGSFAVRTTLLVARAVPPPVWAFLAVFVFLPGLWPGAVALALYNLGVLGRLQAEVVENADPAPGQALRAAGAGAAGVAALSTVPIVAGRFVGLGLYRWEVAIRETVIVGVVGAAGLGRRLAEQSARFDHDGMVATVIALFVVTLGVDLVSAGVRRALR